MRLDRDGQQRADVDRTARCERRLIRLVATVDQPWTRPASDFRHPDLIGYAMRNPSHLLDAALTLCQAWIAAKQPDGGVNVGSYEPWSRAMSGLMDVIKVPGFMANADQK